VEGKAVASPASQFLSSLETRFLSRDRAAEEIERLSRTLSAEVRAELIGWTQRVTGAPSAADAADQILANSTLVNLFREKIAEDLNRWGILLV